MADDSRRPNILLVVSDQERQRSWLPDGVSLPWRDRLRAEGLEFTDYFTHSSPCSPSRASLFTGRYLEGHGVLDNVIMPEHTELPASTPTLGSLLDGSGYRSSYIGKWHLSHSPTPDMEAYGFADWDGNDRHFMGWAGTGVHFDPLIATNAAHWLEQNAKPGGGAGSGGEASGRGGSGGTEPWFLTVALVNPHDVMWFPVDQPGYRERHPDDVAAIRSVLESAAWKDDDPLPVFSEPYPEVVDRLPANFDDDLHTKPEAHRQWRWDQQHGLWGYIDPADKGAWLRHLDYYVHLHQLADRNLGIVLSALEAAGAWDDTIIIFTSDHGDMCGSHGLRSKGPFVYDEIMRVPLYVKVPGTTTPGSVTSALGSHVDLAATICSLGRRRPVHPGVDGAGSRPLAGVRRPGGRRCGTTSCSPRTRPRPPSSTRCATPCAASTTAAPSTPATTGWAGASPPPDCGESPPVTSCSMSTAPSTTTTTSGTTTTPIPTSWSTWPTTTGAAPELRDVFERMRSYEQESFVAFG